MYPLLVQLFLSIEFGVGAILYNPIGDYIFASSFSQMHHRMYFPLFLSWNRSMIHFQANSVHQVLFAKVRMVHCLVEVLIQETMSIDIGPLCIVSGSLRLMSVKTP